MRRGANVCWSRTCGIVLLACGVVMFVRMLEPSKKKSSLRKDLNEGEAKKHAKVNFARH